MTVDVRLKWMVIGMVLALVVSLLVSGCVTFSVEDGNLVVPIDQFEGSK